MREATLLVLEPGLLTTVQDLGRSGGLRYGVTTGGALDQAALTLGNRLLGNAPDAAGLELTLLGPRLRFIGAAAFAVTGGAMTPLFNGAPVAAWRPHLAAPGDELSFAPAAAGARAYLCLAGGIAVPTVLGGRGTDLFGHFGGLAGRALLAGDRLAVDPASVALADLPRRRLRETPPAVTTPPRLRVVLGPQADRFTAAAVEALLSGAYAVTAQADRMGARLSGPALTHTHGADAISEGIHPGSIQVPGDGQPIVLTRARQTIGGYPKIATVIGADLDQIGQLRPGDLVRFAAVSVAEARALAAAYRARLDADEVVITPTVAVTSSGEAEEGAVAEQWTPAAVAALLAELPAAQVTYFNLELPSGLHLEVRRGSDPDAPSPAPPPDSPATAEGTAGAAAAGSVIVAPVLGVFYRRPAPDQPPFAEPGAAVAVGTVIGLIEVMKTYHEVTAPVAGRLGEFTVADGVFVEFGQELARVLPPSAE